MLKEKDQIEKISVEQDYISSSIKTLIAEVVSQSSDEKVQEKITIEQTQLFYTKPIHRARKYDLL